LIGNGIDQHRFDRNQHPRARQLKRGELGLEEEQLVGVVGRLVEEKGHGEFFAMAGRMARKFPRAHFLVVGITEEDQSEVLGPQSTDIRDIKL
jgi:glycosyltransferase involved in cell wall biosynthesis